MRDRCCPVCGGYALGSKLFIEPGEQPWVMIGAPGAEKDFDSVLVTAYSELHHIEYTCAKERCGAKFYLGVIA